MFQATPASIRNRRVETAIQALFLGMTLLLVTPVLLILGVLVYRGAPVISWTFLTAAPTSGMTAGGIFPALLGTVALVVVALVVSVPLGVAAAVYLSEYAGDTWLKRVIQLATTSPVFPL